MKQRSPKPRGDYSTDLHRFMREGFVSEICSPIELPEMLGKNFEVEFCQSILKRDPQNAEVLAYLSETYARKGDYAKGLQTDLVLSKLKPICGTVQYNLACAFALLGRPEKALNSLEKAVEYGFHDLEHVRRDKDLASLNDNPRFQALLLRMEKLNANIDPATSI